MKWTCLLLIAVGLCGCGTKPISPGTSGAGRLLRIERITIAPDGRTFVTKESGRPFHPWGMNYGNAGRLM